MEEPVDWADGFVVVYNINDRTSFINANNILRQIREARMDNCKGSETANRSRDKELWISLKYVFQVTFEVL